MALTLRWRAPAPRLNLQWRVKDERTIAARQANSGAPIATIIGPPGGDSFIDPGDLTLIFDNKLI